MLEKGCKDSELSVVDQVLAEFPPLGEIEYVRKFKAMLF
jgi:hypothetical protein